MRDSVHPRFNLSQHIPLKGTKYILITIFLLVSISGYSQAPNWVWAPTLNATGAEMGRAIAKDGNNNIIVTGSFTDSIAFGSITLTNPGIYLAKYDPSGTVIWAFGLGGGNYNYGATFIAVDGNDNIYLTGNFGPSLTIGATTLTSNGGVDIFIAKFSSTGSPVWAASGGGVSHDLSSGLAVDVMGNTYVTGDFGSVTINFGSASFTNSVTSGNITTDFILVKFDPSGSFQWGATGNSLGHDSGGAIATDLAGNVLITGSFESTISFGTSSFTCAGGRDFFLAKYSSSGVLQWATASGGTGFDYGLGIICNVAGNIYVTGGMGPSITFGTTTLMSSTSNRAFLTKYGPAGNAIWATALGSPSNFTITRSIALDQAGSVYLTGEFYGANLVVGPSTLININPATVPQYPDVYVAKFDTSGNALWGKCAGSIKADLAAGIVVDGTGRTYVTGTFNGDVMHFDTISVTNSGTVPTQEAYISKLGKECTVPPSQPFGITGTSVACVGSTQVYSVAFDPNADSYTWTLPPGWTGSSVTNSITATVGATGGNISVVAVNSCGATTPATKPVNVYALPSPIITKTGSMLTTASGQGTYQWYKNGTPIGGATSNIYHAIMSGSYYVEVMNSNNCKDTSNTIVTTTGVDEIEGLNMNVYPDPVSDILTVDVSNDGKGQYRITNTLGQTIRTGIIAQRKTEINLSSIVPGFYILNVQCGGKQGVRSFIKK